MRIPILSLLLLVTAWAQQPTKFENMPGLLFSNDKLELTVLTTGATMASIVLREDPEHLSPLWNPARMQRELGHKSREDTGIGHFICVDGFGDTSKEEQAAGLGGHGEAHRRPFRVVASQREGAVQTLSLNTDLPLLQENFTRTLKMVDGEQVIYVASQLRSLVAFDRPLCWAEHATMGSPFLDPGNTVVDLSVARAKTRRNPAGEEGHRLASYEDYTWPLAPGPKGGKVDVRVTPSEPNTFDHSTFLMDPARELEFIAMLNTSKRLMLGYLFRRADFPWVQDWESYPPNHKMARGLEFSMLPFDVPRRETVDLGKLFDTPAFGWLPAKSTVETRFLLFYTRVPEGFLKTDDVTLANGRILIEDRANGKRIELKASLPL